MHWLLRHFRSWILRDLHTFTPRKQAEKLSEGKNRRTDGQTAGVHTLQSDCENKVCTTQANRGEGGAPLTLKL